MFTVQTLIGKTWQNLRTGLTLAAAQRLAGALDGEQIRVVRDCH